MNKKVNDTKVFRCKICNKDYSSASSLCNHNKKFHSDVVSKNIPDVSKNIPDVSKNIPDVSKNIPVINKKTCKYCYREYSSPQNRWKHEQKCTIKKVNDNKVTILEKTVMELQKQIENIIKEKGHVHHKTLQKINNQVSNINNGNINNGNVNNGTVINNTFVKFGDVSYEKIFNEKELLSILNKQYMSLEEGITKTHFNEKLPEYSNVFITNLKDPLSYIFNGKAFIIVKKHNMLDDLMNTHINEINLTYEKMKNKIIPNHADRIEKFLTKLNDNETKYIDPDNDRVYSNYKAYKMDAIKLAIYNNSDKKKLEVLKNIKLIEKLDIDSEDEDIEI